MIVINYLHNYDTTMTRLAAKLLHSQILSVLLIVTDSDTFNRFKIVQKIVRIRIKHVRLIPVDKTFSVCVKTTT